jgi:cysteine desulfurase
VINYLDYNASTPIDDEVLDYMVEVYKNNFGNADSRTHNHGIAAREVVETARRHLGELLGVDTSEIIFTSGATESSNLAITGLAEWGKDNGKRHIITTAIEHKATLEPIRKLTTQGFSADFILPDISGRIRVNDVISKMQADTILVSIQHVNNETGIIQPIAEIGEYCKKHNVFFHIDAAQSCGKLVKELQGFQYDLLSATAHKMYGPQGVGILVMREKNYKKPPLMPLNLGGGQESGMRSGTLPVALIAGFGKAAEIALNNHMSWLQEYKSVKDTILKAILSSGIAYSINGDQAYCLPNTLNIAFEGINSEALMIAVRGSCSLSNGSACTSKAYNLSYVLKAMGIDDKKIESSIRMSWGKRMENLEIDKLITTIKQIA